MAKEIEDQLINSFIENDLSFWDPDGLEGIPAYSGATKEDTHKYDLQAFEYFYSVQQEKSKNNQKYESLEFNNFLKIHRPEDGFISAFRDDEPPVDGPAVMWHEIYNRDTGLMKESALKGLKRMLATRIANDKNV